MLRESEFCRALELATRLITSPGDSRAELTLECAVPASPDKAIYDGEPFTFGDLRIRLGRRLHPSEPA